jgi:hypothetical protein
VYYFNLIVGYHFTGGGTEQTTCALFDSYSNLFCRLK